MTSVHSLGQKLLAEFVGTFILLVAGLGAALSGGGLIEVAFAHGLAIAIGVTAVAHVSGAHLNPVVTAVMPLFRQQSWGEAGAYIVAQLGGAVVATLLMMWGWGIDRADLTALTPSLGEGIGAGNGILLEAIATFVLVWVIYAVAVDRDGAFFKVAGLPIGFAVTVGIFTIGPATGAALNPARWFGPALVSGTWDDAYVWVVGPLLGAVVGAGAYLYGIRPRLAGAASAPDTV